MNQLKTDRRKAVIGAFVEGMGVNATARMTGVSKPTILKLVCDLGCACAAYHNDHVKGIKPRRIECDEVWSFIHCKQKNVQYAKNRDFGIGSAWTWTAIDPDTKLVITYHVGLRQPEDARAFMLDLSGRVNNVTQITTDGLASYPPAVQEAFGDMVDYGTLIKSYKEDRQGEAHYSPATCIGCTKQSVIGFPNPEHISTSIVERSNLTIRMQQRRFTRLTNGHSKKIENHGHAVALFFMYYNYGRKHMTLGNLTPAMAACLTDHVWSLEELIGLIPD